MYTCTCTCMDVHVYVYVHECTFMYLWGGESSKMRDLLSNLLGDLGAAEGPVLKDFILLFPK